MNISLRRHSLSLLEETFEYMAVQRNQVNVFATCWFASARSVCSGVSARVGFAISNSLPKFSLKVLKTR